jgi:hypothetical protein
MTKSFNCDEGFATSYIFHWEKLGLLGMCFCWGLSWGPCFWRLFVSAFGLPGLFQCWQGVIKNSNRPPPPVVISVVLTKSKSQFWYTLVPWMMGFSKESNNCLLWPPVYLLLVLSWKLPVLWGFSNNWNYTWFFHSHKLRTNKKKWYWCVSNLSFFK